MKGKMMQESIIGQQKEERQLRMNNKLLLDVITRQAGTVEKAILEGVMNSIEAEASIVDIKFEEKDGKYILTINDDGIGIKTKEELITNFETFGTPHKENEKGIWKQFRMGRGQMFSFGRNIWRTSQFEMEVDIKQNGLSYKLKKNLQEHNGCFIYIELYANPIGTWSCPSLDSFKESIQDQVRFVKIPVYFNGEKISVDPDSKILNWDCQDDNAYYLFSDSKELKIYNLGVYVRSYSITQVGIGGFVVSKKQLKVNFARNDIDMDCPVYEEMTKIIRKNKLKKSEKTYKSMSEEQRINLLRDLRNGDFDNSLLSKKIFQTAQGKWISWLNFSKIDLPWVFAPIGHPVADRSMESGIAICFAKDMMDYCNYSGEEKDFFEYLFKNYLIKFPKERYLEKHIKSKEESFLSFEKDTIVNLKSNFSEEYKTFSDKNMTKVEKRILKTLDSYNCWGGRRLMVGSSETANAWTDGHSYIVLDRAYLRNLSLVSDSGVQKLFFVMIHELSHCDKTDCTHYHGEDFKENFYEINKSSNNPYCYMNRFKKDMWRNRIEDKKMAEKEKELKTKKKLGIVHS